MQYIIRLSREGVGPRVDRIGPFTSIEGKDGVREWLIAQRFKKVEHETFFDKWKSSRDAIIHFGEFPSKEKLPNWVRTDAQLSDQSPVWAEVEVLKAPTAVKVTSSRNK
jgi:hypothetical protein